MSIGRFNSVAPRLGPRPALDGLRGIGVCAVLFGHTVYSLVPSFAAWVDVFFILSGFLITTLLLEENRAADSIDLRRFYKRRVRRLFPLLYAVIFVMLAGMWLLRVVHGGSTGAAWPDTATYDELVAMAINDALAGGLYVYHVVHPVGIEILTGTQPELRPLIPLWSLGVEEHFYFFGVIFIVIAVAKRWVKPAIAVLAAAVLFIWTARALGHVGPRMAWYQRPDGLMLGVLLAFVNAYIPEAVTVRHQRLIRRATTACAIGWIVVVGIGTKVSIAFERLLAKGGIDVTLHVPFHPVWGEVGDAPTPQNPALADGLFWPRFGFSACAALAVVVIFGLARTHGTRLERALSVRPATALGRRSYGIYIIHIPLAMLLFNAFPTMPALGLLLYLPALVLTVELAHRYLEMPLMGNRMPTAAASPSAGNQELTLVAEPMDSTSPLPEPPPTGRSERPDAAPESS